MSKAIDVQRLRNNIAWAVANGLDSRDLVPMLEELLRHAGVHEDTRAARLQLAELLLESSPWRAAALAHGVLGSVPGSRAKLRGGGAAAAWGDAGVWGDAGAWGILGLAHTLLGNYRCARKAYQRALALEPGCASYAHNLGHLLDVAFDEPAPALRWLALAHGSAPDEPEIGASYAHALARTGHTDRAIAVLIRSSGFSRTRAQELLRSWFSKTARTQGSSSGEHPSVERQPRSAGREAPTVLIRRPRSSAVGCAGAGPGGAGPGRAGSGGGSSGSSKSGPSGAGPSGSG